MICYLKAKEAIDQDHEDVTFRKVLYALASANFFLGNKN